jgi:hypothetical protein
VNDAAEEDDNVRIVTETTRVEGDITVRSEPRSDRLVAAAGGLTWTLARHVLR